MYRGVGFNFTVYSIDWERPRVNRNWVWPLQEVQIGIFDAQFNYMSEACDFCDGSFLSSGLFPLPPYPNPTFGYMDALGTGGLRVATIQFPFTYFVEVEGKGWNVQPNDGANGVFFGLETGLHTRVGGRMAYSGPFSTGIAKNAWSLSRYYPTAFDSGEYYFQGWTYGYIQNKDFGVYANKGQVADIKINLIVGVNITVDILFKKEHLISGTPYDTSARVRVFDDFGIAQNRQPLAPQVTGEQEARRAPILFDVEDDQGRAEDVAGVAQAQCDAWADGKRPVVPDPDELR